MNYFDYLRMQRLEDTKENFIAFLVDVEGYTEIQAIQYTMVFGGYDD